MRNILIMMVILSTLIIVGISSFDIQQSQISLEANKNYIYDDVFSTPNVHYSEVGYRVERSFPDFWNIKTVYSYVIASDFDGDDEYYTVVTDIDSMQYKVIK